MIDNQHARLYYIYICSMVVYATFFLKLKKAELDQFGEISEQGLLQEGGWLRRQGLAVLQRWLVGGR